MSTKYEHGYLPKIAYHMAIGNNDGVEYFTRKQIETYGQILPFEMYWICDRMEEIQKQKHHRDLPGFEGTLEQLSNLTIRK